MTSSRSKVWRSSRYVVLALLLLGLGTAYADKRKRVVVLPFEGEKAEKFQKAVIKLVKKKHTVVSADKWEGAAEELSATKVNGKNIVKVSKKLKIDGVIEGKVTKRRDEYIVKLKLYAGGSGEVAGSVDAKADGPRLDGEASDTVKDELLPLIAELESVRGGGGDDEEEDAEKPIAKKKKGGDEEEEVAEKPAKKKKGGDEEEEVAEKPAKKKKGGDEEEEVAEKPAKKKKGGDEEEEVAEKPAKKKKGGDEEEEGSKFGNGAMKKGGDAKDDESAALKTKKDGEEEEEDPLPKKKKGKETAANEDGEEIEESTEVGVKMDKATALSPGNRAIDATLGMSFNARRLSWKHDGDLAGGLGDGQGRPPAYKGVPAPGATLDLTAYPMAFGHKSQGMVKNAGLNVFYDRALLISSKDPDGTKLDTAATRWAVGAVFRYPLNKSATAPVVGGRLRYGRQLFEIQSGSDIPKVNYSMIEPGVFFRMPVGKLVLNAAASYLLISKVGQLGSAENYGKPSSSGFDLDVGADYMLGGALFARAALRFETIGHKFKQGENLTSMRDGDAEQDVFGARDTYLGAAFTVGYLY